MSKAIFNQIEAKRPPSNTFDLSHDRKMSMNMGQLTPILAMDTLPGDKISVKTSSLIRFAPLIAPVMHNVKCYTHYFFVPNRLSWDNWEDFITGGDDGLDDTLHPYLELMNPDVLPGGLADYMGIPNWSNTAVKVKVNPFPFAAYQLIYNEYFRDQNLIAEIDYKLKDGDQQPPGHGPQLNPWVSIRQRAWEHDYFTSALPWTQKGPQATIPLGGNADVVLADDWTTHAGARLLKVNGQGGSQGNVRLGGGENGGVLSDDQGNPLTMEINRGSIVAEIHGGTIVDLRNAFKLQEYYEKNARGGSRYIEIIKSHFGVTSPDARLQRPEYLGGGQSTVNISEVLQTSETLKDGETPQANMAGHGLSVGTSGGFSFNCKEHGWIIGIMSILPKTAYYQGTPKRFSKLDKFDYYFPSFAHIGEQPIYQKELMTGRGSADETIFGYTPRYAEYKHMESSVHGEFKTSLDFWHMGRKFAPGNILLNKTFVEANPTTRIFAVEQDSEHIYAHIYNSVKARRLMPFFGSPKL